MAPLIEVNDFGFNLNSVICWYRSPDLAEDFLILNLQDGHILKFTGTDADRVQQLLSHSSLDLPSKSRPENKLEVA